MAPKARLSKKEKKALLAAKKDRTGGGDDDAGSDADEATAPGSREPILDGGPPPVSGESIQSATDDITEKSGAQGSEEPADSIKHVDLISFAGGNAAGGPADDRTEVGTVTTEVGTVTSEALGSGSISGSMSGITLLTSAADVDAEEMGGEAMHQWLMKSAMERVNATTSTYQDRIHPNAKDVKVENLNIILNGKELMQEGTLTLNWGQRYGLIGPNGCGKSILMTLIGRRMLPLPSNIDCYHVTGEVDPSDLTALQAVLEVDSERKRLEEAAAAMEAEITGEDSPEQEELNARLCEVYEALEEMGADTAEARASLILFGLGFDAHMQHKACKEFSGGWRMRVSLARALFLNPSLLLLDEPTNHLDMEAVVWLERHLATTKKILLLVSHSQDFMNTVCTQIIRMHKKKLQYFGGNYNTYVETRREKEDAQMKAFDKEQGEIAHIKDFVNRFGHGTRKMAQQAQSREKVLRKMEDAGLTEKVETDRALKMKFTNPGKLPPPVLQLSNISFHYPRGQDLYEKVDFGVDLDSRIALVGPNGAGKTTLLKLMVGELIPTSGALRPHPHLRMARYTQHFVDTLDLRATPMDYFIKLCPDLTIAEVRGKLGRFGVSGEFQTQMMAELSDGIKSRVVFAQMALRTPHILMLDEPTNHLDIETIDSLALAINAFEGGVVLVSHDMRLISQVAKDIYECDHKKVTRFNGDIMEYKQMLSRKLEASAEKFEKDRKARAGNSSGARA